MSDKTEAERDAFTPERSARHSSMSESPDYLRDHRGWVLFGPCDIRSRDREYMFCLQQLRGQKAPHVRVGCRYYTLAQAWKHWNGKLKRRGSQSRERNEARQAIAIIRLMLLQAQAYGLISMYSPVPKFDATIVKRK